MQGLIVLGKSHYIYFSLIAMILSRGLRASVLPSEKVGEAKGVISLEINFPCSHHKRLDEVVEVNLSESVSSNTLKALSDKNIEVLGNQSGIQSIMNTPIGFESYEIISDEEMFVYGWCYSVNGNTPEVMPGDFYLSAKDKLRWWYGYAHYYRGEWIAQCVDSKNRKNEKVCESLLHE